MNMKTIIIVHPTSIHPLLRPYVRPSNCLSIRHPSIHSSARLSVRWLSRRPLVRSSVRSSFCLFFCVFKLWLWLSIIKALHPLNVQETIIFFRGGRVAGWRFFRFLYFSRVLPVQLCIFHYHRVARYKQRYDRLQRCSSVTIRTCLE